VPGKSFQGRRATVFKGAGKSFCEYDGEEFLKVPGKSFHGCRGNCRRMQGKTFEVPGKSF